MTFGGALWYWARRLRPRKTAWVPIVLALGLGLAFALPLEAYVFQYFAGLAEQSVSFLFPRAGVKVQFGLQSEAPMAVEQTVGLAWFWFYKIPNPNASVWSPLLTIMSANATGAIIIDWLHIGFVHGGAIYVNKSSGVQTMQGALHFQSPGPQVISVTLASSPDGIAPRSLVEYSVNSTQPKDTVYIETSEAHANWDTARFTLIVTVGPVVFLAVVGGVRDLTELLDRGRKRLP